MAGDGSGGMTGAPLFAAALIAAGLCGAACSGGPALPGLANSPAVAGFSKLAVPAPASEPSHIASPSAEVYARVARGANQCWFGPRGRLAKTHIFHADVSPSMNGGAVEIVVHERAADQPKPWGYKAFRVLLAEGAGLDGTPGAGGTGIVVENVRIPDAEAARMRSETFQWATGTEGCKADPVLDKVEEPVAAVPAPAKSSTRKARPKAAAGGGETTKK